MKSALVGIVADIVRHYSRAGGPSKNDSSGWPDSILHQRHMG